MVGSCPIMTSGVAVPGLLSGSVTKRQVHPIGEEPA